MDTFCGFHFDCRNGRAKHTRDAFVAWYEYEIQTYSTYPTAAIVKWTLEQHWQAVSLGVELCTTPQIERDDKPANKDYAKNAFRYFSQASEQNLSWEAMLSMQHHEFGCPHGCELHQTTTPAQMIYEADNTKQPKSKDEEMTWTR
jgi:hypothetical protein